MSEECYGDPRVIIDEVDKHRDESECLLREQFRLLWEQHVYWTRMVILGIVQFA